jgi:hypothetical protein
MILALTAPRDRRLSPRHGRGAPKRPSSEPLSADVPALPSARSPRLNGSRSPIVTQTGKPLRSLAQAPHPKSEVGAAQKVAERREGRDGWNVSSLLEWRRPDDPQSGGALGGWLLDLRAGRGTWGSSRAASLGPSSVTCASNLMLRAIHECVAVISVDASTRRVRQRSASMAVQSDTIATMIEREIATDSPFIA